MTMIKFQCTPYALLERHAGSSLNSKNQIKPDLFYINPSSSSTTFFFSDFFMQGHSIFKLHQTKKNLKINQDFFSLQKVP